MILEFHPDAELELIEVSVYYEHSLPGLGERFETEVRRATIYSWMPRKSVLPSRVNNANTF
jgi:hypothetical protein